MRNVEVLVKILRFSMEDSEFAGGSQPLRILLPSHLLQIVHRRQHPKWHGKSPTLRMNLLSFHLFDPIYKQVVPFEIDGVCFGVRKIEPGCGFCVSHQ